VRILIVTTEWPTSQRPYRVPFLTRQIDLLRNRGLEFEIFHFEGRRNPFNYLKAFIKIQRKISSNKFDVIHAQWGQSALPILFSEIPLVVTFRGSDLYGITRTDGTYSVLGKILTYLSSLTARKAKAIILVSAAMRKLLPKISQTKVSIIPTGINLNLFRPLSMEECRIKLGLDLTKKFVLFGGDPERADKRFNLASESLVYVNQKYPVEFLIARNVEQTAMPLYINAANLILLTSKHEGSPNIIKEALACNKPIVTVNVGDVSERIGSIRGSRITDDSPISIAEAITGVLEEKEFYESRNSILELDENLITDQIIDIYNHILQ
jgi:teichuronic acid biosynthesis glycosyltransferase TuaC